MTKSARFNVTKAVREILKKGSRGLPGKITLAQANEMLLLMVRFTTQAHSRAKRAEKYQRDRPNYQRMYNNAQEDMRWQVLRCNALEAKINALKDKYREELRLKDGQIETLSTRVGELEVSLQAEQNKSANLIAIGRKELEVAGLALETAVKITATHQGFLELSAMTGRPVEFDKDGTPLVRTVFNGGFEP